MLDYEQFKYKPKKEVFHHDVLGKNAINRYFQEINNSIDELAQ